LQAGVLADPDAGPIAAQMTPNLMLALSAISTSPISVALGAMKAELAVAVETYRLIDL
jgi:hypothetical protein